MERFWSKVRRTDGCWVWSAGRQHQGYGQFKLHGRTRMAHRVAYELEVGPIPDGMQVNHHCDNPPCVNPGHLYVGTQSDNMQDRERRGRSPLPFVRHAKGELNGRSKLTEADVLEIRRSAGSTTQRQMAERFGVSQRLVSMVVRREIWQEVAA